MPRPSSIKPVYNIKMAQRLAAFRKKHVDKNQKRAAEKLQIYQSKLSRMENGVWAISHGLVQKLVDEYNLNHAWLTKGEGGEIDKTPPANATLKTLNLLRQEVELLHRSIQIFQANQDHFIKKIEILEKRLEGKQ